MPATRGVLMRPFVPIAMIVLVVGCAPGLEEPTEVDAIVLVVLPFEVYGQEMLEKEVKKSGNSGRIYLPPDWIGKRVKIIRIDE